MLRKTGILMLIAVLLTMNATITYAQDPQPGAMGGGDPLFPTLGNGGYDVDHYTLDVSWEFFTGFIRGTATIEATATQDLSAFNLDLVGLTVKTATVNGAEAQLSRADSELTITPAAYVPQGDAFTIVITYSGIPEPVHGRGASTTGWIESPNGDVFVPPFGGPGWYPMNDHPSDKATYTLTITVPKSVEVVASGNLIEKTEQGALASWVWDIPEPAASISLSISLFIESELPGSDVPLYVYFPPVGQSAMEAMEETAFLIDDIVAFYESRFGPYPFGSYRAIVNQGLAGGAFSAHGVSVFARPSFTEQVVAQQIAQQWFGAALTPQNRADTWLAQGFATYAETLWTIHNGGEDPIITFYDYVSTMDPPGSLPPDDIFNLSAYERGAWMLKALHVRVGDDVFFEMMRTYIERYRYDAVSAGDFIAVAEAISGEDLGEFFQGWLYDEIAPPVPELGLGGE